MMCVKGVTGRGLKRQAKRCANAITGERMELNKIYCESNLETMARMPDGFIDLTVTSPPYDNLRDYNGYEFDFAFTARELYRVTKQGGCVVWTVGDSSVNGSETFSSFRQALYFKEIGFSGWDTMIWEKESFRNPLLRRYHNVFEYMFVFSKGSPTYFNGIKDRWNIHGLSAIHGTQRLSNGDMRPCHSNGEMLSRYGLRHNVWKITSDRTNLGHPAPFPVQVAADHIKTWSMSESLVYDPFCGSGSTMVAAHQLKRRWIGSEISQEYVDLANKRLEPYLAQSPLF